MYDVAVQSSLVYIMQYIVDQMSMNDIKLITSFVLCHINHEAKRIMESHHNDGGVYTVKKDTNCIYRPIQQLDHVCLRHNLFLYVVSLKT